MSLKQTCLLGAVLVVSACLASAVAADAPDPDRSKPDKTDKELKTLRKKVEVLENNLQAALQKVRDQEKEIHRLKAQLAGKAAGEDKKGNPPKGDVKGVVLEVKDKLVTINIGSDAGLAKGHTLEVYRLAPNPRYLGRIKVIDVTAKKSVAQVAGRATAPIKAGDEVSSRLTGEK